MQYKYLGKTGLKISALSFGAWVTFGDQVGIESAYKCMKEAYDAGVNFFDNAEAYSGGKAEIMMGKIIKRAKWKRSDLILSTKIFWGGNGPNDKGLSFKHIKEGTDAALKRMQTDYVDLIFCHRPDYHTPIEETVWAMNQVIREGKAFYWGTSEWSAAEIMEAYAVARREHLIPPSMEQPEYNMFKRDKVEREFKPLYKSIGLGTTIWSPLASGILTGKYNNGIPKSSRLALKDYKWLKDRIFSNEGKKKIEITKKLEPVANDLGLSLSDLALAWCTKNPDVSTVITGASRPQQVKRNMKVVDKLDILTPEVMEKINTILGNEPPHEVDLRG